MKRQLLFCLIYCTSYAMEEPSKQEIPAAIQRPITKHKRFQESLEYFLSLPLEDRDEIARQYHINRKKYLQENNIESDDVQRGD